MRPAEPIFPTKGVRPGALDGLLRAPAARVRGLLLVLLVLAWGLPGLTGHDPWKPEEAYLLAGARALLASGDALVPRVAGQALLEYPPLAYYAAALSGALFSPWLAWHDAARLASALWLALAVGLVALSARRLYDRAAAGLLLFVGNFGLLIRAHELSFDVAGLAGVTAVLYGLSLSRERPGLAAWVFAAGLALAGLGVGPSLALPLAAAALLLPAARAWRLPAYGRFLAVGLPLAGVALALWPALLYAREPALLSAWAAQAWPAFGPNSYYLRNLPWIAWPTLPLALWALWWHRRALPPAALPGVAVFVALLAGLSLTPARESHAMWLLPPVSLVAVGGLYALRRGAANGFYWFGITLFVFFSAVLWFYAVALEVGVPARLSAHLLELRPGYVPGLPLKLWLLAALYNLAWLGLVAVLPRGPTRPAVVWAAGMAMTWGMATALFTGWVDSGKSYRGVAQSLAAALPPGACVSAPGVGLGERALFVYHAGVRLAAGCEWLLTRARPDGPAPALDSGWQEVWRGARPRDAGGPFILYRRLS